MIVYFRVDSNEVIASGHVMRCLSLADSFQLRGIEAVFLISDSKSLKAIESRGYVAVVLNTDWTNLSLEMPYTRSILREVSDSLLIVDTYQVTVEYVEALADVASICYLGSKSDFLGPLTALINYSTDIDEEHYLSMYDTIGTDLMLGPKYAPLRKEFQSHSVRLRPNVSRVLITTGSTDASNVVGMILDKLLGLPELESVYFEVVVGSMYIHRDYLLKRFSADNRVILHERCASMGELMARCDVAISANGTTVYELSAMGVPAITFAMVEEQAASAKTLNQLGAIWYCGSLSESAKSCVDAICEKLIELKTDYSRRQKLAHAAHQLIDGDGCNRIVSQLLSIESEA